MKKILFALTLVLPLLLTGCSEPPSEPSSEPDVKPTLPPTYFHLSKDTLKIASEGGIETIGIDSNIEWTIKETPQWLSVSQSVENDSTILKISISENTGTTSREQALIFLDERKQAIDTLFIVQGHAVVQENLFEKNVLLEIFVGQNETNSSRAIEAVQEIRSRYQAGRVIATAIHAGPFAISEKTGGLGTTDGKEYDKRWSIDAYPYGMIDRQVINSNYEPQWATDVEKFLRKGSPLQIKLKNTYKASSRALQIQTSISSVQETTGKLQVYLIENNIIAYQKTADAKDHDFVHNNIFRAAVNGTWGEEIQLPKGKETTTNHTILLKESWVPENMSVIAFVYDDSKGVIQATQSAIIQ